MTENRKKKALLFIQSSDILQKMIDNLDQLSYQPVITNTITEVTIEQIRGMFYDIIFLEEGFQNLSINENPVFKEIVRMPMSLRRNTFFVLIGKKGKNPNSLEAFSLSANLLLDSEFIKEKEFFSMLQEEINSYLKFYDTFYRVKKQMNQGRLG